MTDHNPDPGGIFASDTHRRLLGAVANPDEDPLDADAIIARLDDDPHVPLGTTQEEEIGNLLAELEADGDVKNLKDGYKMTKEGREKLSAPPEEAA